MDAMDIRQLAVEVFARYNDQDRDGFRELYHADAEVRLPGWPGFGGVDQLIEAVSGNYEAFPDIRAVETLTVIEGDRAVVEFRLQGRHEGTLKLAPGEDLPPTQRTIDVGGMLIIEARNGRICAQRDYWDNAELLTQLGVLG